VVTLTLQGHEPVLDIKRMIEDAGGPATWKQRLVQSNGAQFDDGTVADIPLDTHLTMLALGKRTVNIEANRYKKATLELEGNETDDDLEEKIREALHMAPYWCFDNISHIHSDLKELPEGEELSISSYDPTCA